MNEDYEGEIRGWTWLWTDEIRKECVGGRERREKEGQVGISKSINNDRLRGAKTKTVVMAEAEKVNKANRGKKKTEGLMTRKQTCSEKKCVFYLVFFF